MAKTKFGIAIEPELLDELDSRRVTDQAEPDFETRSKYIERLLTYGLAVDTLFGAYVRTGEIDDKPYLARNLVDISIRDTVEREKGIRLPDGDVQTLPYSWE